MADERRQRRLRLIGAAVAIACIGWIIHRFIEHDAARALIQSSDAGATLGKAAMATALYFPALCLLGVAWWCVQGSLSATGLPPARYFSIYATTQFAKYLPGNVGHYVGRHLLARNTGAGDAALIAGTAIEAGLLLVAAAVWAGPGLAGMAPELFHDMRDGVPWYLAMTVAGLVLFAAAFAVLQLVPGLRRFAPRRPARLGLASGMYLIFFGGMAICLASSLPSAVADVPFPAIAMAAATSWIAGFIVIGAPAGVGVREAVLVLMLRDHMPESQALIAALTFRMATFTGDFLLFLTGWAIGSRTVRTP